MLRTAVLPWLGAVALVVGVLPSPRLEAAIGDCGEPVAAGPVAVDALEVLRTATGASDCGGREPCICDVNSSGGVTASDALTVLRKAVGLDVTLTCPCDTCDAAKTSMTSVGCEFFATSMDVFEHGDCFAVYVVNASATAAAHIAVRFQGLDLPVESFTRIPAGTGSTLTLSAYDATGGLPPGVAAVRFRGGDTGAAPLCPVASAVPVSSFSGTGLGTSFEITTDVPVSAYQINPFGAGANVAGASLLLPTSAWDTSYIAVNAFGQGIANFKPSLNIVASEDDTTVTIVPAASVVGGGGIPAGNLGQPLLIALAKGQHAQITQTAELTGSVVTADKPIGLMAGQPCMNVPLTTSFCDHGEQMIPPARALGHQYVGVMYRPRGASETQTLWRMVGVADGTELTYSATVGGPLSLDKGQVVQFSTGTPFVVSSQDAGHPFMLFAYMTGSEAVTDGVALGDPDFVVIVPPAQYLDRYAFFTDPTYPETDLVVVRQRDGGGAFHDVVLDCAGTLAGWQAIGNDFEFTRVDLTTGNFENVGNCSTGPREMSSDVPFGVWIWGWGSGASTPQTRSVSYGYPGGMSVRPINGLTF
jgi:hypothetical protein